MVITTHICIYSEISKSVKYLIAILYIVKRKKTRPKKINSPKVSKIGEEIIFEIKVRKQI